MHVERLSHLTDREWCILVVDGARHLEHQSVERQIYLTKHERPSFLGGWQSSVYHVKDTANTIQTQVLLVPPQYLAAKASRQTGRQWLITWTGNIATIQLGWGGTKCSVRTDAASRIPTNPHCRRRGLGNPSPIVVVKTRSIIHPHYCSMASLVWSQALTMA